MTRFAWRIFGLTGGWVLAGPPGGVFGFLCGVLVDQYAAARGRGRRLERFLTAPERERDPQVLIAWGTAALVASLVTADGAPHVSQVEAATGAEWPRAPRSRAARQVRYDTASARRALIDQMLTAHTFPPSERIAAAIAATLSREVVTRLLDLLVRVAAADRSGVSNGERRWLASTASALGWRGDLAELERHHGGLHRDYCAILGVAPTATFEEVRRVYRRLATDLHPDTAGALDAAQRENLGAALVRVREAYEALSIQLEDRAALTPSGDR